MGNFLTVLTTTTPAKLREAIGKAEAELKKLDAEAHADAAALQELAARAGDGDVAAEAEYANRRRTNELRAQRAARLRDALAGNRRRLADAEAAAARNARAELVATMKKAMETRARAAGEAEAALLAAHEAFEKMDRAGGDIMKAYRALTPPGGWREPGTGATIAHNYDEFSPGRVFDRMLRFLATRGAAGHLIFGDVPTLFTPVRSLQVAEAEQHLRMLLNVEKVARGEIVAERPTAA